MIPASEMAATMLLRKFILAALVIGAIYGIYVVAKALFDGRI